MAKRIVAVTAVKHNGDTFDAGAPIDPSKFSKEELKELHDNGAIVIVDDTTTDEVKAENLTPEQLGQRGAQTSDVSATAKQSTADQINAAAKSEEAPTAKK
jgi:3-keto-L-gulonate-6-phosphate decarboxylase